MVKSDGVICRLDEDKDNGETIGTGRNECEECPYRECVCFNVMSLLRARL